MSRPNRWTAGGPGGPAQDLSGYLTKSDAAGTYAQTNDGRLSDQRVPADGSVTDAKVASGGLSQSRITGLGTTLAGKADLVGGQIPTSQVPALALHTGVAVANRAAMLALTPSQVQPGDVASVASDPGKGTYQLQGDDPSQLANWLLLNAPTDLVQSVNGQNGVVVLGKSDVGLGNVDNVAATALRDRSTHTGTQSAATITGLATVATTGAYADLSGRPSPVDVGLAKESSGTQYLGLPGVQFNAAVTRAQTAGQIRYVPLDVRSTITVAKVSIEVTTAPTAAGNVRLGLYFADVDWQPTGSPVIDAGVAVASGATGVFTASVSASIGPGRYLIATNVDQAMTLRSYKGGASFLLPTIGANPFAEFFFVSSSYGPLPSTPLKWVSAATASNGTGHVALLGWSAPLA